MEKNLLGTKNEICCGSLFSEERGVKPRRPLQIFSKRGSDARALLYSSQVHSYFNIPFPNK